MGREGARRDMGEGVCGVNGLGERGRRTDFSFAFSAVSSFPALAACRFSCFAVNWSC